MIPLPPWLAGAGLRLIVVGVLIAAAVVYHLSAVSGARKEGFKAGQNDVQVKWDADRLAMLAAHDAALADALNETDRRIKEQTKVADEERAKRLDAEAAADALRTFLQGERDRSAAAQRRMRDAIATNDLAARARIVDSAVAVQCAPAFEAADLRGRLLQGFDDLAGRLAERVGSAAAAVGDHADEAFSASSECARRYDALTIKKAAASP